ncbi:MAG TPA: amino acid permease [Candidatus Paceibacterota bacterium]|nr:amino acid permease [Candidatus Paceibacterota bacterium]
MSSEPQASREEPALAKVLGVRDVALLGVGALLGGGIFTLLGHAAGLAGGGLVLSMIVGSAIAFLNLNAYVALATTFPQAGGGFHWVRDGLGDIQGFLSGWCSWMASAVACSLYAVSFGLFAEELLFEVLGLDTGPLSPESWTIVLAIVITALFGMINYRGVALSGKIGGAIAIGIVTLLLSYVIFGMKRIAFDIDLASANFSPFLPLGLGGVLQAAALYYIAFEGSEIQAQTGEEVKNPSRVLKLGLFSSWAAVSVLYILVAIVIVGATEGIVSEQGVPLSSYETLGLLGERAIIESARQVMPFGFLIMLVAGLLANMAALNATIYSSSRVLFAMAREKLVWAKLGTMHPIHYTPGRALIASVAIIGVVIATFPLKDIASAADILFIALFIQLNLAYIQLRRKRPDAKWKYIVPFGTAMPILAVTLYFILGIALFHVSPLAIAFLIFWIMLGLLNYLGYVKRVERDEHAREIVYEHSARFHPKSEYRVVLPVGSEETWERFSQIAYAMTRQEGGELIALRIHELAAGDPIEDGFHTSRDKRVLDKIEAEMTKNRLNVDTRVVAARSVPWAILETIQSERADLVLMSWDGNSDTKGFIFGRKIDTVLRRVHCDMLTVKLGAITKMDRIFIPVAVDGNPNLRFTGKVATALAQWFGSTITVGMVVPEDVGADDEPRFRALLDERIRALKIRAPHVETMIFRSDYLASGILKAAEGYDVLLLPAARGRINQAIGVGSIPEQVAKYCRNRNVLVAKGYRGITQPFWDYLKERF